MPIRTYSHRAPSRSSRSLAGSTDWAESRATPSQRPRTKTPSRGGRSTSQLVVPSQPALSGGACLGERAKEACRGDAPDGEGRIKVGRASWLATPIGGPRSPIKRESATGGPFAQRLRERAPGGEAHVGCNVAYPVFADHQVLR